VTHRKRLLNVLVESVQKPLLLLLCIEFRNRMESIIGSFFRVASFVSSIFHEEMILLLEDGFLLLAFIVYQYYHFRFLIKAVTCFLV
jgi:hypothetical protein